METLNEACPFPDAEDRDRLLWSTEINTTFTVAAGATCVVSAAPFFEHPALIYNDTTGAGTYAVLNPAASSGGTWGPAAFKDFYGLKTVRNLSKSFTVEPANNDQNMNCVIKAAIDTVNYETATVAFVAAAHTAAQNQPVIKDCVRSAAQFDYKNNKVSLPPNTGCYVTMFPNVEAFEMPKNFSERSDNVWISTIPTAASLNNALYTTTYGNEAAVPTQVFYHPTSGLPATVATCQAPFVDGSMGCTILITVPAGTNQTFNLKTHMLHEFLCEGDSTYARFRARAHVNKALLGYLEQAKSQLSGVYPASYNAEGVVSNFLIDSLGPAAMKSALGLNDAIPGLGSLISSGIGAIQTNAWNSRNQQRRNDLDEKVNRLKAQGKHQEAYDTILASKLY